MKYLCVKWIHDLPSEPVFIYSEIDSSQWERRKVEIYADGRMGFADASCSFGGSRLSKEPLPSMMEIARDPQFIPVEIGRAEFEKVWSAALLQRPT